jgi:hypothetical protein
VRVAKAMLASLAVVVLMGFFVPALAQTGSSDNPPEVRPNVIQKDKVDPGVLGSDEGILPFTGGQIVLFVVIGIGAIGAGTIVLRSVGSRRDLA